LGKYGKISALFGGGQKSAKGLKERGGSRRAEGRLFVCHTSHIKKRKRKANEAALGQGRGWNEKGSEGDRKRVVSLQE